MTIINIMQLVSLFFAVWTVFTNIANAAQGHGITVSRLVFMSVNVALFIWLTWIL